MASPAEAAVMPKRCKEMAGEGTSPTASQATGLSAIKDAAMDLPD